jgi:hypothetical protein
MPARFDGLLVEISGPMEAIAKFQPLLEALDGSLTLSAAIGCDDGQVAVIRWSGRSARPRPMAVRGRPWRAKR